MTKRHKALAAISACVLFWGFSFISIKIAVSVFPPMILGALRFGIALVFLFFFKKKFAPDEKIQKRDLGLLVGAGLTGVTFYFFFENNGVALIPASEASIITAAIPVITLIAERAGEKISSLGKKSLNGESVKTGSGAALYRIVLPAAGALISLTGVGLVAGVSFALSGTAKGYLFMAGTCFSWVFYCFLTRPLFARRSRIFIVFWQSMVGFIGFLPFVIPEFISVKASWQMPGFDVWGHVIFLGICCSAMGYWLYATAMETLGVGTATLFINFIPVVSAIGSYFILGERLQPLQWFGGVLVLAGVYLAMSASRKAVDEK